MERTQLFQSLQINRGWIARSGALVMSLVFKMIGSLSVFAILLCEGHAATDECRTIRAAKESKECYQRQRAVKPEPPSSTRAKMNETIEKMKLENERLTKRLQGICRGC